MFQRNKMTTNWSASSCFFCGFLYSAFKCQLFSNGENGPPDIKQFTQNHQRVSNSCNDTT